MDSDVSSTALSVLDCSIRKSPAQSLFDGSPRLIAAYHVLLRLLVPRYPSYSLSSLTVKSNPSLCSYQRAKRFTSFIIGKSCYPSLQKTNHQPPKLRPMLLYRIGGDEQIRTADLRLAKAALSHLSYIPMVGPPGLEPGTLPLSGVRSSHLSYEPEKKIEWQSRQLCANFFSIP